MTTAVAQTAFISRPTPASIAALVLDAAISETHSFTNTVTDHPVEQGANVSDHSRPEPERISMEAIVTASPLDGQPIDVKRIPDAYWQLVGLREAGALVTVVTSLTSYTDMAIESVSIPRSAGTVNALRFSITLKKIRLVQNKLTKIVVAKDPRAQPKVNTGAKPTPATAPQTARSFLKQLQSSYRAVVGGNPALNGLAQAVP